MPDEGSIPSSAWYEASRDFHVSSRSGSGPGTEWQKKLTLSGRLVRCRIVAISARALPGVSSAHGNEPRPPDSLTATAIAAPVAPAMGA